MDNYNHFFMSLFLFPAYLQEEFLKDVMQFLILRGHTRLIPQGGLAEFPDAILNAKRLDLFNLYREVSFLVLSFLLIKRNCQKSARVHINIFSTALQKK